MSGGGGALLRDTLRLPVQLRRLQQLRAHSGVRRGQPRVRPWRGCVAQAHQELSRLEEAQPRPQLRGVQAGAQHALRTGRGGRGRVQRGGAARSRRTSIQLHESVVQECQSSTAVCVSPPLARRRSRKQRCSSAASRRTLRPSVLPLTYAASSELSFIVWRDACAKGGVTQPARVREGREAHRAVVRCLERPPVAHRAVEGVAQHDHKAHLRSARVVSAER